MTTNEGRCEPPPELRGQFGVHWVVRRSERGDLTPIMVEWEAHDGRYCWRYGDISAEEGYRYLAPVTPPAVVAALVEALEKISQPLDLRDVPHVKGNAVTWRMEAARSALAAYREAGR